jgi:hypothetical protein
MVDEWLQKVERPLELDTILELKTLIDLEHVPDASDPLSPLTCGPPQGILAPDHACYPQIGAKVQ